MQAGEEVERVMDVSFIHADLTVDEIKRVRPETLRVFLRRRIACDGCAVTLLHGL